MNLYEVLKSLNISYDEIEHEAVFTVNEANSLKEKIEGIGCKNLFLTDKKGNYFLYLLIDEKRANLKDLAIKLNGLKLTFANDEELKSLLGLTKGSVTPLGIINDKENKVVLVVDKDLVDKKILVHPNVNTKTMSISYEDLIRFIEFNKNKYILY